MLAPASAWGLLERAQTLLVDMDTIEWEVAEQEEWTYWAAQVGQALQNLRDELR